jgi:predicted phosphate transport protein (TIGR00153 family)
LRFRIIPSNDQFFPLFTSAASTVAQTAHAFAKVVDDFPNRHTHHRAVAELEHQGDEFTRTIFKQLDESFVTPFDREDIHALATILDDITDDIYHLSEVLVLVPFDEVLPEFKEQVDVLVAACVQTVELIERLQSMKGLRPLVGGIDELESQGDAIYRRTLGRLFSGDLEPLDVIKWKDLVDSAEEAIDRIEDLGDLVTSILVKHA